MSTRIPLATRMRPKRLDELLGQPKLVSEGASLRRAIEKQRLFSMILWGPPGCGKTTLAGIIEHTQPNKVIRMNAVSFAVKELRQVAGQKQQNLFRIQPIVFIDEIHRLNKTQQDVLLPYIEDGSIILIGATTENPAYELTTPLISRCRVYRLEGLCDEELKTLIYRSLEDQTNGLGKFNVQLAPGALETIVGFSSGDARIALNLLETVVEMEKGDEESSSVVTKEAVERAAGAFTLYYDHSGDQHYGCISAFIKSMRGSDPDATLYYLARMIEGGEDPRYIMRRILICASEDVGNADPAALILASAAAQALDYVGMPEGQIILSQAACYVATAPKSNTAVDGILKARKAVRNGHGNHPIPRYLSGSVELGTPPPAGYKYSHNYPQHFTLQQYLPDAVKDLVFYEPSNQGREISIRERLMKWWGNHKKWNWRKD